MKSNEPNQIKTIRLFFEEPVNQAISASLNEKVLTTDLADSSFRLFSLWVEDGLIDDFREKGTRKHYFSLVEMVWIGLLENLRGMGLPKEKIKKVKSQLLFSLKGIKAQYPYFEFYLMCTVLYKRNSYLVIDTEGNAQLTSLEQYTRMLTSDEPVGYMIFPIAALFSQLLDKIDRSKWTFDELFSLSREEQQLLAFIRDNNFNSIKIVNRNGEINRIEGTERVNHQKRIIEILKEKKYQSVQFEQQDGKIVSIVRTIKTKL